MVSTAFVATNEAINPLVVVAFVRVAFVPVSVVMIASTKVDEAETSLVM